MEIKDNSYEQLSMWFKASANALDKKYEQDNQVNQLEEKKIDVSREIKSQRGDSVVLSLEAYKRLKEADEASLTNRINDKNNTSMSFEKEPYGSVLKFSDKNTGEVFKQVPVEEAIKRYDRVTEYLNKVKIDLLKENLITTTV